MSSKQKLLKYYNLLKIKYQDVIAKSGSIVIDDDLTEYIKTKKDEQQKVIDELNASNAKLREENDQLYKTLNIENIKKPSSIDTHLPYYRDIYKKLTLILHPDIEVIPNNNEDFALLKSAYDACNYMVVSDIYIKTCFKDVTINDLSIAISNIENNIKSVKDSVYYKIYVSSQLPNMDMNIDL